MDDLDILDRRGRLARLVAASGIGLVVTVLAAKLIAGLARQPEESVGQASMGVCVIALFALTTLGAHHAIEALRCRAARRTPKRTS